MLTTVDDLTGPVASAGLAAAAGWIGLVSALWLAGRLPGLAGACARRLGEAITPRFVRTAVAALIGIGLGAGTATAAEDPLPNLDRVPAAAQWAQPPAANPPAVASPTLDTGPTLDAGPTPDPLTAASTAYRVRSGDTLWHIAERHLSPQATPAEIDRSWRLWWAANRAEIGPNPHLIRPGQDLRQPQELVKR